MIKLIVILFLTNPAYADVVDSSFDLAFVSNMEIEALDFRGDSYLLTSCRHKGKVCTDLELDYINKTKQGFLIAVVNGPF